MSVYVLDFYYIYRHMTFVTLVHKYRLN